MSEISQKARLTLFVADFAMAGTDGKVDVVGCGVNVLGFDPQRGVTSRFAVVAYVDVPASMTPAEPAIELTLLRDDAVVKLSGPLGEQPVRISHASRIEMPQAPVPAALRGRLTGREQIVADFAAGLPLAPGAVYEWALQLDLDEANRVTYPFAVAAPVPAPVLG